ncbi:hypothetical protein L7F22_060660 [Adiantum nelumboides]|nr:hypothetical protein [Adiantum nelumboides]
MEMLSLDGLLLESEREFILGSVEEYIAVLAKCKRAGSPVHANQVYMRLCCNGLETHKELGNYLIPMLVKCGKWPYAHQLFPKLICGNELCWTALIQGSVELDNFDFAFDFFQDMQQHQVCPSKFTYIALLKACASSLSLKRGWRVHSEVVQDSLEQDPFVASVLMDMYTSCDLPSEAADVFEDVPVRDVALWNSLIVSCIDSLSSKDGLTCLRQMHSEGLSPDAITYLCCLKACKSLNDVRAIHTEIMMEGLENAGFIGNALVGAYAKYSSLSEALDGCRELMTRDAISWNVILAGFLEQGRYSDVLQYFEMMKHEGVALDHVSYIHALKACTGLKAFDGSLALHTEVVLEGFEREGFLAGTLVDTYAKLGALPEAKDTLYEMPARNVVAWTALIGGLTEHDEPEETLCMLMEMQSEGISSNCSTLICCLRGCGNAGDIGMSLQLHGEIIKKGYEKDAIVGNALVDTYARCKMLEESRSVFSVLPNKDVVSWTSLINAYAEEGMAKDAASCLRCMQLEGIVPDAVAWNAVIFSYSELKETEMALKLFAQMQEQGLLPVVSTFASILHGCSSEASLKHGRRIHGQILRLDQAEAVEISLATALVDMYSKCSSMDEAEQVFGLMPTRSLVAWNVLIAGYVRKGETALALQMFDRLIDEGIKPDEAAFLTVLTLCTHVGLVRKGIDYFESMIFKYGIIPSRKHYNCLLDLLGRAGQLNEALLMFAKMPAQPDLMTWNTFIAACQKWGEIELGQQAFQLSRGLRMPPHAGFVLMSNLYADTAA